MFVCLKRGGYKFTTLFLNKEKILCKANKNLRIILKSSFHAKSAKEIAKESQRFFKLLKGIETGTRVNITLVVITRVIFLYFTLVLKTRVNLTLNKMSKFNRKIAY